MRLDRAFESWDLELRATRKSDRTRETYKLAVDQLGDFLKNDGRFLEVEKVTRDDLRAFILHVLEDRSPATAKQRHSSLSAFFRWMAEEGEIEANPMSGVKPPKVPDKTVPVVSQRQFDQLIEDCGTTFVGRRDEALIRVLWDTGLRVSELVSLKVDDVSLDLEVLWVLGKGEKERRAPFTVSTTRALDRYLRLRAKHPRSILAELWLGERGRLGKTGVEQMLRRRSLRLGLPHISPHMFRHSLTDRLLSLGANEGDVLEIMGWSSGSRSMLDRYGRAVSNRRAFETYRRLIG